MLQPSNYGGDGDQAETKPMKTPTTFSELVQKEVMALLSSPGFLSELTKKLKDWQTQVKEKPKPENVQPCDFLETDKLILPKALVESLAALDKNNKEFAETMQQTVKQCSQLKDRIDVLSLKVHNMVERGKLKQLPRSRIEDSQVTFSCVCQKESKCDDTVKTQLKDRFEESALKVQNMVECEEPVQLLPPQINDCQATFTCFNEKESSCEQTEKKDQFEQLSLEVHKIVTRKELRQLPSPLIYDSQATFICSDQEESKCDQSTQMQLNDRRKKLPFGVQNMAKHEKLMELPTSRVYDSQATFNCVDVEGSKCDQTEKKQLYNNLLNKFRRNALDTSLENRPSKLIISKTVTKFRPHYSKFSLNMAYKWDFSSSSNSLTEDM